MFSKTPEQNVESLISLKLNAYVGGEKIASVVDHPAITSPFGTKVSLPRLSGHS